MPDTRTAALDGLRALACLAVVAWHNHLPGAGAGWLGVDVFFVLSGWLITRGLLAERDRTGSVRLVAFWVRRSARLAPALLGAAAVAVLVADVRGAFGSPLPDVTVAASLALTSTTDLFIGLTGSAAGVFSHAWSLGVEEQFYLAWPLVLAAVRRRAPLAVLAGALAVASFAAMAMTAGHVGAQPAGYYLPHTRAWELLAGCLLALLQPQAPTVTARRVHGWTGAALLAYVALLAGPPTEPVAMTVSCAIAVIGTLLVLLACQDAAPSGVGRVLGRPALVWLGRRSYALYLYHPLLLCLWPALSRPLGAPLAVTVALALAAASFRWIEIPVQRRVRALLAREAAREAARRSARELAAAEPLGTQQAVA